MSGFTPQTLAQLQQAEATAFASQPGVVPANTDVGSSLGPIFLAAALATLFTQQQGAYTEQILRLANVPTLPSGLPNPDVDSFVAPWGFTRLGATAASGSVTCSTPSPVSSQIIIPAGSILASPAGVQFQIQTGGTGYSATFGGYPIASGLSSASVPVLCLTAGIVGNIAAGTALTAVGGSGSPMPPAVNSITNATAFTDGQPVETDAQLKTRFTLGVSTGTVATGNAISAAILAVQEGLIYSIGDRVNADGSAHVAYFTAVVNVANSGTAPLSTLLTDVQTAVNLIRSEGISFQVIAPTLVTVNSAANVTPIATLPPGVTSTQVQAAAEAAFSAFVNGIGLSVDTTPTTCSLARAYAAILGTQINGVNVVQDVQALTLNNGSVDLTANFANQFVAGTASFTIV